MRMLVVWTSEPRRTFISAASLPALALLAVSHTVGAPISARPAHEAQEGKLGSTNTRRPHGRPVTPST